MIRRLHREQFVPGRPDEIWNFFATPANLAKITPPHMGFRVVGDPPARMYPGQMIEYRVGILPGVRLRWLTEITHVREGSFFVDEQRLGPYRLWHHEHRFTPAEDGRGVHVADLITYDPGWGFLGGIADALFIRRQLDRIFAYRADKVRELFG